MARSIRSAKELFELGVYLEAKLAKVVRLERVVRSFHLADKDGKKSHSTRNPRRWSLSNRLSLYRN